MTENSDDTLYPTADNALLGFTQTPIGKEVVKFCGDPKWVTHMKVLAYYGYSPVRVLEKNLPAQVTAGLGERFVNSQCGKLVRDAIADEFQPNGERDEIRGTTFRTGALYHPI